MTEWNKIKGKDEESTIKEEYGMIQKGLDAVDRIIKESPQYKALIEGILEDLEDIRYNIEYDEEIDIIEIIERYKEML